jgi:RHS repeat-associated protein
VVARQLYAAWGEVRWSAGTLPTDFTFTGQRNQPGLGLVYMHARYYHVGLGRWTAADTVVPEPGNPQDLNRYSYVRNSPLVYSDPGGHGPPYPVVLGGEMPVQWELYHAAYYAKAIFYENFTYEEYSAAYTAGVIHAYGAGAEGYGSLARCIAEGAANALVGREDENWPTVQFAMWDAMMGGGPSAAAFAQASVQQVSTLYDAATLYAGSGGLTGGRLEGWNQYSSVPDISDSPTHSQHDRILISHYTSPDRGQSIMELEQIVPGRMEEYVYFMKGRSNSKQARNAGALCTTARIVFEVSPSEIGPDPGTQARNAMQYHRPGPVYIEGRNPVLEILR